MFNIFANSINGFRLFNLGLDGDEGFVKAEVERLNAENKDEELIYGYARVSATDQSLDRQLMLLRKYISE